MMTYTTFIVGSNAGRLASLKNLIEDYCPYLSISGEYAHFGKALIDFELKRPSIIFLDGIFFHDQSRQIFEEMHDRNIVFIFIGSKGGKASSTDVLSFPYDVDTTLFAINTIIKSKRQQLEKVLHSALGISFLDKSHKNFFTVSSPEKIEIVHIEDVVYCQADGKYTSFFMKCGRKVVASRNIGGFELVLHHHHFFRVHQTYIVNVLCVSRILKKEGAFCELSNGILIPIASRRQDEFYRYLNC